MGTRLGLDMGTSSLGWCLLRLDDDGNPAGLIDAGVRVYSDGRDPQSGAPANDARRVKRGARRRRDRFLTRQKRLLRVLINARLLPSDKAERLKLKGLDPLQLRAAGVCGQIAPFELGRALLHLNLRRGFASNRRRQEVEDAEEGVIKPKIQRLRDEIERNGHPTIGTWLHAQVKSGAHARFRTTGEFYPVRDLVMDELEMLLAEQMRHHPVLLSEEVRTAIRRELGFQRPLRPATPGRCSLLPREHRAPLALPSVQMFRIAQELANLRLRDSRGERALEIDERQELLNLLLRQTKLSFGTIRKVLRLERGTSFNLEDEKRSDLRGDAVSVQLADPSRFGPNWFDRPLTERDAVVAMLRDGNDEFIAQAFQNQWHLSPSAIEACLKVKLPDGFGRVSLEAARRLLPHMTDGGCDYSQACAAEGLHHSDLRIDAAKVVSQLPRCYGQVLGEQHVRGTNNPDDPPEKRYGTVPNPTVHIGLNQLSRLVNAIITRYGRPDEIVVELARDLKNAEDQKRQLTKRQAENQRKNKAAEEFCRAQGVPANGRNRLLWRLWTDLGRSELERSCPYSGKLISAAMLFSDAVEIEHILPFGLTYDDSPANKTVCLREANRQKGRRAPFEAFGNNPNGFDWQAIAERAQGMPPNKSWRFEQDALTKFKDRGDFQGRQLTDTAYLARLTRFYLQHLYSEKDEGRQRVRVVPGRMTAWLRRAWGLDGLLGLEGLKNRTDHRHHAIDAFVVACTDQGMLQRISAAAANAEFRTLREMPEPWPACRDALQGRLKSMVISHKLDHGKSGELFEETAYGAVGDSASDRGAGNVVHRKVFITLSGREVGQIRDAQLRRNVMDSALGDAARGLTETEMKERVALLDKKQLQTSLTSFSDRWKIRRVRLIGKDSTVVPIRNRHTGEPYKWLVPASIHRIDIYELPDGRWDGVGVTMHQAATGQVPRHVVSGARRVMRIHKADSLAWVDPATNERVIVRVRKLEQTNSNIVSWPNNQAGGPAAKEAKMTPLVLNKSYNALKKLDARPVHVDILGNVTDPGPVRCWGASSKSAEVAGT